MLLIDAQEIAVWAGTGGAAQDLPNIVRQLILATGVELAELVMPGGSSVRLPGWDGMVRAGSGNLWVPEGDSVWELSCDGNPLGKANEDYRKRTDEPLGLDRSQITYVAVTARRFNGKEAWVQDRRNAGIWRDVRFVDADTLVSWLEVAPAIGERFARLIGKAPDGGYTSLREWWDRWVYGTLPVVTPELVLAGRSKEIVELGSWFRTDPAGFYVQGYTQDEGIAFVAASAVANESDWGAEFLSRALVVETPDAWRDLCALSYLLVLVRDFRHESVAVAGANGHHTLVPLADTERAGGEGISLPRLGRDETVRALMDMGMSENEATLLSWKTGRRLPIIRRQIVDVPGLVEPAWSKSSAVRSVVPLVLLGQWEDDHTGDQRLVSDLAGESYDAVQRQVVELAGLSGSPVTKIGNKWRFLCQEESWHLLAKRLTSSELGRFGALAVSGLRVKGADTTSDGVGEGAVGIVPSCSDTLRQGIAQGIVVMALNPTMTMYEAECAQLARRVVATVLGSDGAWSGLGRVLVLLAEAGPEEFMSAVEYALNAEPSAFSELFSNKGDHWFLPYQSGYVFSALEILAWSEEHFGRISGLMARVAGFAGDGSDAADYVKRVAKLFAAGIGYTEASDCARLNALERLVKGYGDYGWRVLCAAFPTDRDFILETLGPFWRPWGSGGPRLATREDYSGYVDELERMLVEYVGVSPDRWVGLLDLLWYLTDESRVRAVALFVERAPEMVGGLDSVELWHELRRKVAWFRMHADKVRAFPSACVEDLVRAYDLLTPEDSVARYAWRFDFWPWGYEEGFLELDLDEQERLMGEARRDAVREVYDLGGACAVFALAEEVRVPQQLGSAVCDGLDRESVVELALRQLGSEVAELRAFGRAVLRGMHGQAGWDGLEDVLGMVRDVGGNGEALADLFLSSGGTGETWERLANETILVRDAYWRDIGRWELRPGSSEELAFAAGQLVDRGRGVISIALLAGSDFELDRGCVDVAVRSLTSESQRPSGDEAAARRDASYFYNIARLFEKLDEAAGISGAEIAVLEMPFAGALDRYDRDLKIHSEVMGDPGLFGMLVARCFAPDEGQSDYSEIYGVLSIDRRYASRVLSELRNLPGVSSDGVVDGESLINWVTEARRICSERGCLGAGDRQIGALMANSPHGLDGVWPCEPVRDLLDMVESLEMRRGFASGVRKLRGVSQRGLFDGGDQERSLSQQYRDGAANLLARWPQTALLLRQVAEYYDSDAGWHDERAEWLDHAGL